MFSQVFIKGWTGLCLRVDMPSLRTWIISVLLKPIIATKSNCCTLIPKYVPTVHAMNAFLEKARLKCWSQLKA